MKPPIFVIKGIVAGSSIAYETVPPWRITSRKRFIKIISVTQLRQVGISPIKRDNEPHRIARSHHMHIQAYRHNFR